MAAARRERERLDGRHGVEGQRRIKMRKQRADARRLEAQGVAEPFGGDRDQHEIGAAGEMFGRSLFSLRRGRKMDEAIFDVVRRAIETAALLRLTPQRRGTDFLDEIHFELSLVLHQSGILPDLARQHA